MKKQHEIICWLVVFSFVLSKCCFVSKYMNFLISFFLSPFLPPSHSPSSQLPVEVVFFDKFRGGVVDLVIVNQI